MKSQLTFWGGVESVTGANFLFETEKGSESLRILVDCGFFQGTIYATEENAEELPYDASSIDFLFVTHAHADHIGRIPKLVRAGFRGVIYSTPATRFISEVMFEDALKILTMNATASGKVPLYEKADVELAYSLWKTIQYHEKLDLPGGLSVMPKDAGHILGSAMFEFARGGRTMVFTGDLGNTPSPLVKDTEKVENANYFIMESVYGNKNHENRESRVEKLKDAVTYAVNQKGVLIIPAFSLERSQVILYELNNMVEEGKIPSIPVFLDSPLAIKVTEIYHRMKRDFNAGVQEEIAGGDDIFKFPKLKLTSDIQESRRIEMTPNPKIIIAGGGMSEGGRVVGHERNYLSDPKSTLLLVGYQAVGTLGRLLSEGAKEVEINGKKVKVEATIMEISGFSSHKDSDHLVEFVADSEKSLDEAFIVMGEQKASMFLAQRLRDELGVRATVPERGKPYKVDI